MGWGSIPDRTIKNTIEAIKVGKLDPDMKTYVFRTSDGRCLGVAGKNEAEAREWCRFKEIDAGDLLDVEVQTVAGLTIPELLREAKNRGLK